MTVNREDTFVSVEWLAAHLGAPDIVIVDGSWHLPTSGRDAHAEYLKGHIPGAVFFDIDRVADTTSGLPHMLPKPEVFSSAVRKLGIGDGQKVVIYDAYGLYSAPRVWWTFRTMGAREVVILEGGLPAWIAAGHPLETGPVLRRERHFTARLDNTAVRDLDAVRSALAGRTAQLVDARSHGRFIGAEPEPRPGVRSGHAPGSLNLPFDELVADGSLKPPDALRRAFAAAGVDTSRPVITSCGSGVTAAIVALAFGTVSAKPVAVYDGSWAEWGARADTPVVTGE